MIANPPLLDRCHGRRTCRVISSHPSQSRVTWAMDQSSLNSCFLKWYRFYTNFVIIEIAQKYDQTSK